MPACWLRAAMGVGPLGRVGTLLIVACVREPPYLPVCGLGGPGDCAALPTHTGGVLAVGSYLAVLVRVSAGCVKDACILGARSRGCGSIGPRRNSADSCMRA